MWFPRKVLYSFETSAIVFSLQMGAEGMEGGASGNQHSRKLVSFTLSGKDIFKHYVQFESAQVKLRNSCFFPRILKYDRQSIFLLDFWKFKHIYYQGKIKLLVYIQKLFLLGSFLVIKRLLLKKNCNAICANPTIEI